MKQGAQCAHYRISYVRGYKLKGDLMHEGAIEFSQFIGKMTTTAVGGFGYLLRNTNIET